MTNEAFAEHLGVAVRTVAYWRQRHDMVPLPAIQEVLDAALERASDREKEHFRLLRGRGASLSSRLSDVADDVAGLTTWITATDTSDNSIDRLASAAASLAEIHTQSPPQQVLGEVMRLHQETHNRLRTDAQRLRQTRELFRIDSELLAHACLLFGDLGDNEKADSYGQAALLCAQESGANEAKAWSVQAKTARWQGRYAESADLASRGFESSPLAPIRLQLAHQEANAAALLGDRNRAQHALQRAEKAAETTFPNDSGVSAWSFPRARQAVFALSVATYTGDPDGALRAAAMADDCWASGDPLVPATWAQVKLGAAIAYLLKDSLDGAAETVAPVLDLPPELRMSTVTGYMDNLDRHLRDPRFVQSGMGVALRDQIRTFNAGALRNEHTVEGE
ncbi:MAG: hypothetical protein GEV09_19045 [Pseudonocardiaceae bacterium]|nr:hypothetical protein [Pseudonocardiaceae bacterium]